MKRKKGSRRREFGPVGVRAVAVFEAAKGGIVVIAGLGMLALIHRDVQGIAEEIVRYLHINPARHFPRIFLDAAATATDARLWALALAAMLYASVRFAEAYGLWRQRVWAEWFAILTGSIYLPIELYELTVSVTLVKVTVFVVNLFIVAWLSLVRWKARGSS
jgi:uncharacterized membrane protein (DUF2068 family)